jgi:CelD/BcsL family acetyltransferase involved in cellulose biosynthesis
LRLIVFEDIPEDPQLRSAWNGLVLRMERPEVFYTYEWALAVQRAYKSVLNPLLFLAYDEREELCGVAALAHDVKSRCISFLGATTGDYCDFLSAPGRRPQFLDAVLSELRRRGVKRMAFANLPSDSATATMLPQSSRRQGCRYFVRTAYVCAQIVLDRLERSKDGHLTAPGQKRLRRFAKAMALEGPLRLEHSRTWNSVAPSLQPFLQAHVARFLDIGRISNLANAQRRVFLEELSKLLSEPQWLVLSQMRAGDRVVAWHYGFQFRGSWFWYQPTFDSSVEKYWPGFCLLTQVIQEATENPAITRLDLGLGSEAYKAKFANESRETLYVALHISLLEHWGTRLRYQTAAAVKASPALEKIVGSIRNRLRAVRAQLRNQGGKQTLAWMAKGLFQMLWLQEEVLFFEWENWQPSADSRNLQLLPLDLNQLAVAAMEYEQDEPTLTYLLRSARRLRASGARGFILANEYGRPLHFAWVASFDGFHCAELNATLLASRDSVILFDCWTPAADRGKGYFKQAVQLIAARMRVEGKRAWIFSTAGNVSSLRALNKTGFKRRHSLRRYRLLRWQMVSGNAPQSGAAAVAEVSAHV